jgi:AcrR family transcriptional regulator
MSPKQQLNQILEGGFDSVVDTGVRAFTVESLAKRLAMSKKTIYKFFPTKENLIRSIMRFVFTQIDAAFNKVMVDEPNPAVQFIKIMETIAKFAGRVPVDKIVELKSLHPEIWKEIESFRLSHQDDFYTILHDAQEWGLARDDINMRATSIIYINIINSTFQPEFFLKNDLPIRETIRGFVKIVAHGIFTDKGMKAIKEHYEQN